MPQLLFANESTLESLGSSLLAAGAFGVLGIVLLALGFKVFELITPRLKVEEELGKGNMAVAVLMAAALIGVSLIVLRAIGG
jgi:putative membrane protein